MVTLALPVNEVPGERPTLPPADPEMVVGPVLVTVLPASTLYKVVVPRRTRGARACAMVVICVETNIPKAVVSNKALWNFSLSCSQGNEYKCFVKLRSRKVMDVLSLIRK